MAVEKFTHFKLEHEIRSISGYMMFQKELILPYKEKEIFYYVAYSVTDNSCCGVGGCAFLYIPGFIYHWHSSKTEDGIPISEIEPVADIQQRKEITEILLKKEICTQVNFK